MKVSVLGCGRWGSFIGWYLANNEHQVNLWGRENSHNFNVLKNTGRNEYVELDKRINLTSDLKFAVENSEIIIKENLPFCFPEFEDYIGQCKFVSCAHIGEKGCRICQAVADGDIQQSRYDSYRLMYDEVKDYKEWENK